jgi:hypothetical protein
VSGNVLLCVVLRILFSNDSRTYVFELVSCVLSCCVFCCVSCSRIIQEQDTQHNTQQEGKQPTNPNTHAYRGDLYRVIQEELPPLMELISEDILNKKCHINLGPILIVYRVTFIIGNALL